MDKCVALAHPLPTLAALAPTSSPLRQQRFITTTATSPAPVGSRIAPSSQEIRLRNNPVNYRGVPTREREKQHADAERELASLPAGAREGKALRSLVNHREGLSVFVARAWVPMDNNAAERALRGAAIGRRLSFGSNSETGARFTAVMYSIVGTLELNGIDVLRWLEAWLGACADHGGRAPHNLSAWLPWSMCEQRKRELMAPR